MNLSAALPTFLITLREGVEVALVVGIVLAALQKAGQAHLNIWVYSGIFTGLAGSTLIGTGFIGLLNRLNTANQPYAPVFKVLLEAGIEITAIVLLSWMLIWMTRQARTLKSEVESVVGTALQQHDRAGWGVFGLICAAVLREGFETVLLLSFNLD
jgi:high-affinity iron transporter